MNNEEKNIKEENNQAAENASIGAMWNKLNSGVKAGIIAAVALILIVPIILVFALSGNGGSDVNEGGNGGNVETPDEKINYTVTVVDSDGVAIEDVKLTFKVGSNNIPWTTDSDGKASYKTDKTVKVTIDTIPTGYNYAKLGAEQSFDEDGKLTVTLEKIEVEMFVVRVVDQYGNPVAGVAVQVCDDMNCMPMSDTDENGVTSRPSVDGDYAAKITELPEGDSVDSLETYYDLIDNEVTITVNKD